MARINLLPWREQERQRKKREFFAMLGAAAGFAAFFVLVTHLEVEHLISGQQARNQFIEERIKEVEQQIAEIKDLEKTKADLLARMEVIQELQASRPEVVRLVDAFARTVPEGVSLRLIDRKDSGIKLEGDAQSNARVSAYMRNIDGSPVLADPRLDVIETRKQQAAPPAAAPKKDAKPGAKPAKGKAGKARDAG